MTSPFEGMNINICLHIEAKTGCLALALKNLGGQRGFGGLQSLVNPR